MIVNAKPSAVYVLKDVGRVKIGRSARPKSRARALAYASGRMLHLEHASEVRPDGSLVETTAHRLLQAKRLGGDWFDVTPEEAIAAVKEAIRLVESGEALEARLAARGGPVVILDEEACAMLDALRRNETDIPTRSEMARRCIQRIAAQCGLTPEEKADGKAKQSRRSKKAT